VVPRYRRVVDAAGRCTGDRLGSVSLEPSDFRRRNGDVPSRAELADSHGLVHRNVPKTALLETVRQVFRGGRSIHPVQVSKDAEPEDMVGARVRDRLTLKR
jgi:hypothetical protein